MEVEDTAPTSHPSRLSFSVNGITSINETNIKKVNKRLPGQPLVSLGLSSDSEDD